MNKKTLFGRCSKHYPLIKILLIMKLTIILICFTGLMSSMGSTYAQLTLNLKQVTVKEALNQIENQSDLAFMYEASNINVERVVDIKVENKTIGFVLDRLFPDRNVRYTIVDKHVVLFPSQQDSKELQNQQTITGKVTNDKGEPIPGVSVIIKGTTNGTITDVDGNYSLGIPADAKVLVFTYVGMTMQEITIGSQTVINVVLKEAAVGLDEIVVIGYGTVKKSDLTGAVASIKSEAIKAIPLNNVMQSLSGRATGVQVMQNTGAPGSSISVRIRGANSILGSNEPLYVVDGFPYAGSDPSVLSNSDIQSVEILKDASATAIYGSRGANGVVLITTRRGKAGITTIDFESSYGMQSISNKIDLMNAE